MAQNDVLDYIRKTPYNSNVNVVKGMLNAESGDDIIIEALSVTENGTYTAPEGKAYSPVTVNVSGGSSDFSTAEVTVTTVGDTEHPILNACAIFGEEEYALIAAFEGQGWPGDTYTVPLYKGQCVWNFAFGEEPTPTVAVTGDITYDDGNFLITGNGTITIS